MWDIRFTSLFSRTISQFFARALNGPWTETEERKVMLDDVVPGICKFKHKEFDHVWSHESIASGSLL